MLHIFQSGAHFSDSHEAVDSECRREQPREAFPEDRDIAGRPRDAARKQQRNGDEHEHDDERFPVVCY